MPLEQKDWGFILIAVLLEIAILAFFFLPLLGLSTLSPMPINMVGKAANGPGGSDLPAFIVLLALQALVIVIGVRMYYKAKTGNQVIA